MSINGGMNGLTVKYFAAIEKCVHSLPTRLESYRKVLMMI